MVSLSKIVTDEKRSRDELAQVLRSIGSICSYSFRRLPNVIRNLGCGDGRKWRKSPGGLLPRVLLVCCLLFLLTILGTFALLESVRDIPSGWGQTMSATAKTVVTSCPVTDWDVRSDLYLTSSRCHRHGLRTMSDRALTVYWGRMYMRPNSTIQQRVLYFYDSWVDITSQSSSQRPEMPLENPSSRQQP